MDAKLILKLQRLSKKDLISCLCSVSGSYGAARGSLDRFLGKSVSIDEEMQYADDVIKSYLKQED